MGLEKPKTNPVKKMAPVETEAVNLIPIFYEKPKAKIIFYA